MFPLVVAFFAVGLSSSFVGPYIALFLTTAVDASTAQVTLFLVLSPLASVLGSGVVGRLSDRRPIRRTLMAIAGTAGTIGCLVTAFERHYWILLGLTVTFLALPGSLFPQIFAYARQVLERDAPDRVAMALSALRTVFSLAWVTGPALAAFALEAGGFALVFGSAAAMYALATAVVLLKLSPEPPRPVPHEQRAKVPRGLRLRLAVAAVAFTLLHTPMTVNVQTLPLHVSTGLGGRITDAGWLIGLCALLEIPLMLGLGALTTRVPLRYLLYAGASCGVAYFTLAATAQTVGLLGAGQVLNALFISATSALGMTFMQDMLPSQPGTASTIFANAFPIGAMLAGPLVGLAQTHGYPTGYAICAVLCALGLLTLVSLRSRVRDRLP